MPKGRSQEDCSTNNSNSYPLSQVKKIGGFQAPSAISCENLDDSFFISNIETVYSIEDNVTNFCSQHYKGQPKVCDSGRTTFFYEDHPDLMNEFIENISGSLIEVPLPPSYTNQKDLPEDFIKAMMFICTKKYLNESEEILTKKSISREKKINLINELKKRGLLTYFFESHNFIKAVRDNSVDSDLKRKLFFELLNDKNFDEPISFLEKKFGNAPEEIKSPLSLAVTDYLNLPSSQINSTVLEQTSGAFPDLYKESRHYQNNQGNNGPIAEELPICKNLDPPLKESLENALTLTSDFFEEKPETIPFKSKSYPDKIVEYFSSNERWKDFENHIFKNNNFLNNERTKSDLKSIRAFYCLNMDLKEKIEKLSDSSAITSKEKEALSNEIFDLIEGLKREPSWLRILSKIQPYLSDSPPNSPEDRVKKLLQMIDSMEIVNTSSGSDEFEKTRVDLLSNVIDRYLSYVPKDTETSSKVEESLNILSRHGGKIAEGQLATLFKENESDEFRKKIIQQYHPRMLNRFGDDDEIKLFSVLQETDGPYIADLLNKMKDFPETDGFSGSGSYDTNEKILKVYKEKLLAQLRGIQSRGPSYAISRRKERNKTKGIFPDKKERNVNNRVATVTNQFSNPSNEISSSDEYTSETQDFITSDQAKALPTSQEKLFSEIEKKLAGSDDSSEIESKDKTQGSKYSPQASRTIASAPSSSQESIVENTDLASENESLDAQIDDLKEQVKNLSDKAKNQNTMTQNKTNQKNQQVQPKARVANSYPQKIPAPINQDLFPNNNFQRDEGPNKSSNIPIQKDSQETKADPLPLKQKETRQVFKPIGKSDLIDSKNLLHIKDKEIIELLSMESFHQAKALACAELSFLKSFHQRYFKRESSDGSNYIKIDNRIYAYDYPGDIEITSQINQKCNKGKRGIASIGEDSLQEENIKTENSHEKEGQLQLPNKKESGFFESLLFNLGL